MGMFAQNHILSYRDLGIETKFPWEIWSSMGSQGLLNPENLMEDRPCLSIAQTARAMVENAGNLGLGLSWMIHQMTARYLVRPHLACLVDKGFWDRVKTGEATVAFAVSEPNAGAHPKYMSARAKKEDRHHFLSGKKAYLTNAPIACHDGNSGLSVGPDCRNGGLGFRASPFGEPGSLFSEDLEMLFKNVGEKLEGRAAVLAKDLSSSARIASTVAGIRK